jgi:hypothetical protein
VPNAVFPPVRETKIVEPEPKKVEEVEDEYAQEFEEFEISQSM